MALAVLDLLEAGGAGLRFSIDTGTSRYFELRFGRSIARRHGESWVDDITYSTPIGRNPHGGDPFHSRTEIVLPAGRLRGGRYAQLFSFRDADRGSPTFSDVVPIPGVIFSASELPAPIGTPKMSQTASFVRPRRIAHATIADRYALASSIDDVVASVVKLATPIVEKLLAGAGGAGASAPSNDALGNVLGVLLKALVRTGAQGATSVAKSLSMPMASPDGNRFSNVEYSRPFVFGIDDALIGAIAGPVLQMLPQLLNAANQRKVQMRQADDKLISDLVSEVNRRLILQQLASSQPQGGVSPEVAKLIAMLQAQGTDAAPPAAAPAAPTAPAAAQSLSFNAPNGDRLSSRAIVSFKLADAMPWNDTRKPLFAKGSALRLNVQLTVGAPVPRSPLPKAIVRVFFRNPATHSTITDKTFKQKNLPANAPLALDFTAAELSALPVNEPVEVLVELRWRAGAGEAVYKAMGTTEVVLVDQYLLKSQGGPKSPELELTDMTRFRPFWNKIWESPVLDAASGSRESRKYSWELALTVKYSVLLSAQHESNGLMETKLLKAADDADSVVQHIEGRMKAGIDLSVREMNKLASEWQGYAPLPADKLEALLSEAFAAANASEVITSLKAKGNAGERGMVWAVPVFRLVQCTLASPSKTDDSGQIIGLREETVTFPLPVAMRFIGLKATNGSSSLSMSNGHGDDSDSTDAATEPEYSFEGYQTLFSIKVGLTPASKPALPARSPNRGAN